MDPTAAGTAARGRSLTCPRVALAPTLANSGVPGPRRVAGGAGLGRRRVLVASLQEPLEPLPAPPQEGAVALPREGDEVASDEITPPAAVFPALGKTVRVRFVLKKQCAFGQSFHLVGDDPVLGLWDPSKAIALDWSEGHDWTVEKDLPANSVVEFKFLLQDSSGKFHWQDGANRSLQTGETTNTLVIYEDWGDVKNQKIVEHADVSVSVEGVVVLDEGESIKGVVSADEIEVDDNQDTKEEELSVAVDDKMPSVAKNTSVQGETMNAHEANQLELRMGESEVQDELHEKVNTTPQNGSVGTFADGKIADDNSILSEDGVPVENGWADAFEQDKLWGWKALQQLLMSLGFKMDAT